MYKVSIKKYNTNIFLIFSTSPNAIMFITVPYDAEVLKNPQCHFATKIFKLRITYAGTHKDVYSYRKSSMHLF